MMGRVSSDTLEQISTRLRKFLEFLRPKLQSGAIDMVRLSKIRQMADIRIGQAAVHKPDMTLQNICELCSSQSNPTRFDQISRQKGLLQPEEFAIPFRVPGELSGYAIQCALTFDLLSSQLADIYVSEFVSSIRPSGSASAAQVPAAPMTDPSKPKIIPQRIRLILEKVTDLWSIPENTQKIQKMLGNPNSAIDTITVEVERDPGLSAQLLRIVNSAFYGMAGQIKSIRHAIVVLGYQETKRLVTVSSLISKLSQANPDVQIDFKAFWSHSLWTAHAASMLASLTGQAKPDDMFTAGLLHDIGKLVIYQHLTFAVKQIFAGVAAGVPYHAAEERVLGVDHTVIGASVCERWHFPPTVIEAVRNHLQPVSVMETLTLPRESVLVAAVCALSKFTPSPEQLQRYCSILKISVDQYEMVRSTATEQSLKSLQDVMIMGGGK